MSKNPGEISAMFSQISARYDMANHVLSFGLDRRWRRRLIEASGARPNERVLDLCTGTADMVIEFARLARNPSIIGLDNSCGMLNVAQEKLSRAKTQRALLVEGDALQLPFGSASFDIVSIAFGLRNLADRERGLQEMFRVLRPGGRLLVLEFSTPSDPLWRRIYSIYLERLMPFLGSWLTGSRGAYRYLHDSIQTFPTPAEILNKMRQIGFEKLLSRAMMGGVAVLYRAERP